MTQLVIRKIGPIEEVDITLNKVNVIIGPQSSGKSTINKIACYCTWVEKRVSLDQSFDFFLTGTNFLNNLVEFHKMKGYFREGSYIEYHSEVVKFSYTHHTDARPAFEWVNQFNYKRTKISYIPAERNVVSLIAGWDEVKLPNNNIFNFMKDWNTARKLYASEHNLFIDCLNSSYYYDEETETDYLKAADGTSIRLMDASSGQQSMIPLYMLVLYFTRSIYEKTENTNVKNQEREQKLLRQLSLHALQTVYDDIELNDSNIRELFQHSIFTVVDGEEMLSAKGRLFLNSVENLYSNFLPTHYSSLFIEEPELNLFPSTQRELFYFILHAIQGGDHKLFLTTHSPYILYALNNCIMGATVKEDMPEKVAQELECYQSWIDPEKVSVWQIENGRLVSIQDTHTRSIGKHYFNRIMNDTLNEYYRMLNYFKPSK